jgi:hypothetical protein
MQAPKAAFTRKHSSQRSAGLRWIGGTDYAQKSVLKSKALKKGKNLASEKRLSKMKTLKGSDIPFAKLSDSSST